MSSGALTRGPELFHRQASLRWSQPGSNRRPLRCHRSALPTELWPQKSRQSSAVSLASKSKFLAQLISSPRLFRHGSSRSCKQVRVVTMQTTLARDCGRLELRHIAPEILEAVETACLRREEVEDHVEVVGDDPLRLAEP